MPAKAVTPARSSMIVLTPDVRTMRTTIAASKPATNRIEIDDDEVV